MGQYVNPLYIWPIWWWESTPYNITLYSRPSLGGYIDGGYQADAVTSAYIVEGGVWNVVIDELPGNGGIDFREDTHFDVLVDGYIVRKYIEGLYLVEAITAVYSHVTQVKPPPNDKLQFTESITAHLIKDRQNVAVTDAITLTLITTHSDLKSNQIGVKVTEVFQAAVNTTRSIADTLTFIESISFYMPNVYWYNPGTANVTPEGFIKLDDYAGTHGFLTFRAPIFGDTDKNSQTRIQRNTRGGDLEISNDPMWPTTNVFHFEFVYLTGAESSALLTFISETLGQHIRLTDQYNRQFVGYIVTPEDIILQPKVNGFSAKFDFQIKEA